MKKKCVLMGLISALLMAGMMFSACPMEDGGGGGGPAKLPALPENITAVANEMEAKALLNALTPPLSSIRAAASEQISSNIVSTGNSVTWNVNNTTAIPGVTISSRGNQNSNLNFDDFDELPMPGQDIESTLAANIAIQFTGNKTENTVTIYQASNLAENTSASVKAAIPLFVELPIIVDAGDFTSPEVSILISGSVSALYDYGLTASSGGKGGKIILNANVRGPVNGEIDLSDINEDFEGIEDILNSLDISITYSGSLNVYGADDKMVYQLPIKDEASCLEALAYFGVSLDLSPGGSAGDMPSSPE